MNEQNPYASSTVPDFLTEELTGIPWKKFRDCLIANEIPSFIATPFALLMRTRGLIGWRLKPVSGFGSSNDAIDIPYVQLPAKTKAQFAPWIEQLEDLNFELICCRLPKLLGATDRRQLGYLSPDGRAIACLAWQKEGTADPMINAEFNSFSSSDPEYTTIYLDRATSKLEFLDEIDFINGKTILMDEYSLTDAAQAHYELISGRSVMRFDAVGAIAEMDRRNQRRAAFLIKLGWLRHLTPTEVERLRRLRIDQNQG